MKKLIITNYNDKLISILFENGRETAIDVYEDEKKSILDNIYVGRVKDIVANINAAFIEIESGFACYYSINDNKHPIFLNRKNTDKICQGDLMLVQVRKDAVKTKAPVVSCDINITGKYIVISRDNAGTVGISKKIENPARVKSLKNLLLPFVSEEYGFIVRTDAENASDEAVTAEAAKMSEDFCEMLRIASTRTAFSLIKSSSPEIEKNIKSYKLSAGDEIVSDNIDIIKRLVNVFPEISISKYDDEITLARFYGIETKITQALSKRVWLKSGGYLIIEPTEALTVIDVNTGKFDGSGKDREQTFFKINSEAVYEIERQLRLRNISGIIIVDFISMKSDAMKTELADMLRNILKNDPVKTVFVDYTALDLAEITRKKVKKSLYESLN